jgi:type IV pilus assembly protein PilM
MAGRKEIIVNLGTSHVSVCIFSLDNEQIKLSKFVHKTATPESSDEEHWMDFIRKTLSEICKENKIKGPARLILPGSKLLSKTLRVPKVESTKQRQVVSYELGQKMPFPLAEMTWDFQVIDDDGIEQEILAFAVKPHFTEELCKIAYECGLLPTHLCPGAILDHRVLVNYRLLEQYHEKALVNIGAKTTTLLFSNPSGFLVRTINLGGNALSDSIAENFGISLDKAEDLKINYLDDKLNLDEADPAKEVLRTLTHNFFNKIGQEISRSIVTYKRLKKGKSPECILATGNSTASQSLVQFLSESQQLPVLNFDPLELVELEEDMVEAQENLPYVISEPIGFARLLLNPSNTLKVINLLPQKSVNELKFKRKKPFLLLGFFLICLLPSYPIFNALSSRNELFKNSEDLKREIDYNQNTLQDLNSKKSTLNSYQHFNTGLNSFLAKLAALSKQLHSQTRFINNLQILSQSDGINNIWIDSINYLEGTTTANNIKSVNNLSTVGTTVNISGRYLVDLSGGSKSNSSNLRNDLIDANSLIQESLTKEIINIPQVLSLSKKVFSTEGKGDLFNRYFTHFELELTLDTSK